MKTVFAFCVALILSAGLFPVRAFAFDAPEIISETAVLMDAETGQVLYQKEPGKRMYPASTTKIMTGLLAAENCSPEEIARVSASAVDIDEWDSANIALVENEEIRVDSLMYAMMLPSANDAANVLAEHITGSQDSFAAMMNARAKAVGAASTNFANSHGLHDPNHYTTAYDVALITREAIKNETFLKYFGTPDVTIPPTNLNPFERTFKNYQYMLADTDKRYYPDVIGGKVGYTHEARHTMSTFAERNGRGLICVVMNSPNRDDKFTDTKKLLDFGFDEFVPINVKRESFMGFEEKITRGGYDVGVVKFRSVRDFSALLHNSLDYSALAISYSSRYGDSKAAFPEAFAEFRISSGNKAVPDLLGTEPLERGPLMYTADPAETEIGSFLSNALKEQWAVPLAIFFVVLVVFILFALTGKVAETTREKRRQKRLEEIQNAEKTRYSGPVPVVGKQFLTK